MPSPPSGVVTFLFTDVQGSTALWDRYPEQMGIALADHDRRVREAVEAHEGYVFTTAGDSFSVAFADVRDAFGAALALQQSLRELSGEIDLRVRAGIHTGEATERDGDYFGTAVNRSARIMSAAHGGQILISGSSSALLGDSATGASRWPTSGCMMPGRRSIRNPRPARREASSFVMGCDQWHSTSARNRAIVKLVVSNPSRPMGDPSPTDHAR